MAFALAFISHLFSWLSRSVVTIWGCRSDSCDPHNNSGAGSFTCLCHIVKSCSVHVVSTGMIMVMALLTLMSFFSDSW